MSKLTPHGPAVRPRYRGAWLAPKLVGPAGIIVLLVAIPTLWILNRPTSQPVVRFVGELLGVEGTLLLSIALVLASALNSVDLLFDGVDRAALWHRGVAIAGIALLIVHSQLTSPTFPSSRGLPKLGVVLAQIGLLGLMGLVVWAVAPRWKSFVPKGLQSLVLRASEAKVAKTVRSRFSGWSIWRTFHRFIGLFVAIGFTHALLDSTIFSSTLLRSTYVAIGAIGLAFYAYREVIARRLALTDNFVVEEIDTIDPLTTEITLRPLDHDFSYTAGQFAVVYLEATDGWHRHPFSIASAPSEPNVRFTIKSLGDFTKNVANLVKVGMPAVVSKARGHFDYRRGTEHQVWIAGGVGIAPILSWLRGANEQTLPNQVELFYSARGPAAYSAEIRELISKLRNVNIHIIDTSSEPQLTSQRVTETAGRPPKELSVFICGPTAMVDAFQKNLAHAGVKRANIHREYFNWR